MILTRIIFDRGRRLNLPPGWHTTACGGFRGLRLWRGI